MTFSIRKLLIAMAVVGLFLSIGQFIEAYQDQAWTEEQVQSLGDYLSRMVCVSAGESSVPLDGWNTCYAGPWKFSPPIDGATDAWGQKLRSVKVGGGVLVWSVGTDGKDATRDDYWYFSEGNFNNKGAREETGYGPRPDGTEKR